VKFTLRMISCIMLVVIYVVTPWSLAENSTLENSQFDNEDTLLIQFEKAEGLADEDYDQFLKMHKNIAKIAADTYLIECRHEENKQALLQELGNMESILYAEENKILSQQMIRSTDNRIKPNDFYYDKQWGLEKINAREGWARITPGENRAVVAVIDSGVDMTHPDLEGRVLSYGYNFYDNNQYFADTNGHGTSVAGIIAAETNNYIGIAGVGGSYNIKILPLRTTSNFGQTRLSDFVKAVDYAIAQEVDVINISMGSTDPSAIENSTIQRAIDSGIVVVASAGNYGNGTTFYPASYPGVISVGSINENSLKSRFSNYNSGISVVAPGENIFSTSIGSTYGYYEGTSFSAPFVSGVAALIKAQEPTISPQEVKHLIESTSTDLGTPGFNALFGHGLIDMEKIFLELLGSHDQEEGENVSPGLEDGKEINEVERLGGTNRYDTAGLIAKKYFGEGVDMVILARGDTVMDEPQITNALIASSLTGILDVPVLLTKSDVIPRDTLATIDHLKPRKIMILGDDKEISLSIEEELQEQYVVKRINEYSSDSIAEEIALMHLGHHKEAFIVGIDAMADAITISTVASDRGIPILLAEKNRIPEATKNAIKTSAIDKLYIIGGDTVISKGTAQEVNHLVKGGVERIWGLNRFETSIAVAEYFWSERETVVIANGVTMVDAVTASIAQSPLILVRSDRFVGSTKDYLLRHSNYLVIGGDAVVDEGLIKTLQ